jgi:hypothetical protein
MIDNSRRGSAVRAIRYIQNPDGPPHIYLGHAGTLFHEILADAITRHKLFVAWEVGPKFYCFPEEVAVTGLGLSVSSPA